MGGGQRTQDGGLKMKVAVLGASGFLGTELVNELVERGHEVLAVDRTQPANGTASQPQVAHVSANVTRIDTLISVLPGVEEVYHLAGMLGTTELDNDVHRSIESNIIGTINVLDAAIKCGVPRVFFASKCHVWLNTYTITKHAGEQFCRLYTRLHPVRVSSLRYFNMYGAHQKLYPVRKFIPTFAIQARRGLPIQVFGDGEQTVDMIYVKDAVRITVDFLRTGYVDQALDCGTGEAISVNTVAELVNRFFGNNAGIQHLPMRRGESERTVVKAATGPLQNLLGPIAFTPVEQALEATLRWYAELDDHVIDAALAYHGIHQRYGVAWT